MTTSVRALVGARVSHVQGEEKTSHITQRGKGEAYAPWCVPLQFYTKRSITSYAGARKFYPAYINRSGGSPTRQGAYPR